MSRDEDAPDGPLVRRQVEERFERTAYQLTILTLRDSAGREQTIQTTAEHPAYVLGQGWVAAGTLRAGDTLAEPGAGVSTVARVEHQRHPAGTPVYNLRVGESHTYFVRAEGSDAEPVWVHNTYADAKALRANLKAQAHVPSPGDQAGHLVPTGAFSNRNQNTQGYIREAQDLLAEVAIDLNDSVNGFFTNSSRHLGSHTNKYFEDLAAMLRKNRGDEGGILQALGAMQSRLMGRNNKY